MNSEAKLGARVMTTGTYADQVQIKQELVIPKSIRCVCERANGIIE